MTATGNPSHGTSRPSGRRQALSAVAGGLVAVLGVAAIASSGGGAAGAAEPLSQATGRFLSGSVGGTSLDVVAGIEGEKASYPGNPGPNQNSLNVELLNKAIELPFGDQGLQLPDPTNGAVQLGAVAQYAKANQDGSALGASGAVDSNGGIGVGGSKGVPTGGATIDLSSSPLLAPIAAQLANLKLTIGAVSARASQVAIGETQKDPSANCVNGPYHRVSENSQAGNYKIAGLGIDLTSPLLANIGSALTSALDNVLSNANIGTILDTLNGSPLGQILSITGVPDPSTLVNGLLDLSLANGSITLSLSDGSLHVDLAKLLKFLGLDINNLCPNTALIPYLVHALTDNLPAVLGALLTSLSDTISTALGNIQIKLGGPNGVPIGAGLLTGLINKLTDTIVGTANSAGILKTLLDSVGTVLDPVLDLLTNSLVNLIANGQDESGGRFTETSLQLNLLPGGSTVAPVPIPPLSIPKKVPTKAELRHDAKVLQANIRANQKHAQPPASAEPNSVRHTLLAARHDAAPVAVRPAAVRPVAVRPVAAVKAAGDPFVQLNLAQASVGPNAAPPPSTPTTAPPTVPSTHVPTGVPAGSGTHGENVTLPLVLVLLGLVLAGGGAYAYRGRGKFGG